MCCQHVKLEPRTQTFSLHARPSPGLCCGLRKTAVALVVRQPETALLSVDIAAFLVCAWKFIGSLAFLFIFVFIWHTPMCPA
jgi:hypothetical protein